jgi:hypothetical protein
LRSLLSFDSETVSKPAPQGRDADQSRAEQHQALPCGLSGSEANKSFDFFITASPVVNEKTGANAPGAARALGTGVNAIVLRVRAAKPASAR